MLITILIVCFLAIIIVALTFFYSKNVSNYGSRLEGIEKYEITDKMKSNFKDSILENENVKKVSFNVIGRIIYIHIDFDENIELENAKTVVVNSLEIFADNILSYYDIDFDLKSDNFVIFGAKNAVTDHISWNNNRDVPIDDTENEEGYES